MDSLSQVSSVMKIFHSINEQPRAAQQNPLFIDFLVKETNLNKPLIQEYVNLYRNYRAREKTKTNKGQVIWSEEERQLFKKFLTQFRPKMNVTPICQPRHD